MCGSSLSQTSKLSWAVAIAPEAKVKIAAAWVGTSTVMLSTARFGEVTARSARRSGWTRRRC
jgi:hypothetical protein